MGCRRGRRLSWKQLNRQKNRVTNIKGSVWESRARRLMRFEAAMKGLWSKDDEGKYIVRREKSKLLQVLSVPKALVFPPVPAWLLSTVSFPRITVTVRGGHSPTEPRYTAPPAALGQETISRRFLEKKKTSEKKTGIMGQTHLLRLKHDITPRLNMQMCTQEPGRAECFRFCYLLLNKF